MISSTVEKLKFFSNFCESEISNLFNVLWFQLFRNVWLSYNCFDLSWIYLFSWSDCCFFLFLINYCILFNQFFILLLYSFYIDFLLVLRRINHFLIYLGGCFFLSFSFFRFLCFLCLFTFLGLFTFLSLFSFSFFLFFALFTLFLTFFLVFLACFFTFILFGFLSFFICFFRFF